MWEAVHSADSNERKLMRPLRCFLHPLKLRGAFQDASTSVIRKNPRPRKNKRNGTELGHANTPEGQLSVGQTWLHGRSLQRTHRRLEKALPDPGVRCPTGGGPDFHGRRITHLQVALRSGFLLI